MIARPALVGEVDTALVDMFQFAGLIPNANLLVFSLALGVEDVQFERRGRDFFNEVIGCFMLCTCHSVKLLAMLKTIGGYTAALER